VRRRTWITTTVTAGVLALAGCGTGGSGGAAAAAGGSAATSTVALKTWSSPLGEVVVTPTGSAVYVFDKDTPNSGTSACSGSCASLWPAVTTTSAAAPQVQGLTGTVGTIARDGGTKQLTLDGHPLYTYAGDSPGQVSGEGVKGTWWVVSPSGQAVHPAATAPSSSSDPGYSY
jgi:predicted lipoprotein with Yx(FWY)xxD motif